MEFFDVNANLEELKRQGCECRNCKFWDKGNCEKFNVPHKAEDICPVHEWKEPKVLN